MHQGAAGMEQRPQKMKRKYICILALILVIVILFAVVLLLFRTRENNPVLGMTFEECLAFTTKDTPDAKIGVVVLQNDIANIAFYGSNAEKIPYDAYEFEIGSLTKTFTAALVLRAEQEGIIRLSDPISRFIKLPDQTYYPTIERLLTHQSGYRSYYLERPMIGNFFSGGNSFYRVSRGMLKNRIGKVHLDDRDYPFLYSNFGVSVLGLMLEEVYQTRYTDLVNALVQQELGMQHTYVSDGSSSLTDEWRWAQGDAYIPAGALISTADDMAIYARALLKGNPDYLLRVREPLAKINATTERFASLDIRIDSCAACWMIDDEHHFLWHNGGTTNYASYLAFDPARQIAVVILTNLSPDYRIPATVLGAKLMLELQKEFN
jgi:CubicO group peptidase (beta-lactamase class C family)